LTKPINVGDLMDEVRRVVEARCDGQ